MNPLRRRMDGMHHLSYIDELGVQHSLGKYDDQSHAKAAVEAFSKQQTPYLVQKKGHQYLTTSGEWIERSQPQLCKCNRWAQTY